MAGRAAFDPFATFVHLQDAGAAQPLKWTASFWRKLTTDEGDRVVGALHGVKRADFHPDEWEMHPAGDELLYLLSGALDVILQEPRAERRVVLRAGEGFIVPRGLWHRLVMHRPSDLLFCTPPHGTQHKPVAT
jgi:mannose-6-phosphate isomerase-like protein (cupin superfamily)